MGDKGNYPHQSFKCPGLSPPTVWDQSHKIEIMILHGQNSPPSLPRATDFKPLFMVFAAVTYEWNPQFPVVGFCWDNWLDSIKWKASQVETMWRTGWLASWREFQSSPSSPSDSFQPTMVGIMFLHPRLKSVDLLFWDTEFSLLFSFRFYSGSGLDYLHGISSLIFYSRQHMYSITFTGM